MALFIDALFLLMMLLVVRLAWRSYVPAFDGDVEVLTVLLSVVFLTYLIGMRMVDRGTLGYRIVGIQYASMLNETPTTFARLYRAGMAAFLMFLFAIDHCWILFDPCKQAWHDKMSGFYVVKRNARPVGTQPIVRRVINFLQLTFIVYEPDMRLVPKARAASN